MWSRPSRVVNEEAPLVLVTGAAGFIGRHVVEALCRRGGLRVVGLDRDSPSEALPRALDEAHVVFHLAGVNRPETPEEYQAGNVGFTQALCAALEDRGRQPLVVFTSSIQAALDNPYGTSKRLAEEALRAWAEHSGAPVAVFRLANVFGKWSRPYYNSAVATFCHNAAHGLESTIHDPDAPLALVYIDEVVEHLVRCLDDRPQGFEIRDAAPVFRTTVGEVAECIRSFPSTRQTLLVPDFQDPLTARLYATYLSHLEGADVAYALHTSVDERGALAEILKQPGFGQICVSRTAPGVTRGNHYHHTKCEKFMVLEGEAVIRLRDVRGGPVFEHRVNGRDFVVLDIAPGFTHSIENVGKGELVTLFFVNELFDPQRPDTFFQEVLPVYGEEVAP